MGKEEKDILEGVKKEMEKPHNNRKELLVSPRPVKALKYIIFAIPAIIFFYLIATNFLISHEFNHFYDIGSEKDNYLGPSSRITLPLEDNGTDYRNITNSLVYFSVPIPRGSEKVYLEIRFTGNLSGYSMLLGAKDQESWHYSWNTIFNPSIEKISDRKISPGIYRINPILPNLSLQGVLNAPGIAIGATEELLPVPNNLDFEPSSLNITTSLRGQHTFYLYLNDSLRMEIEKQDLNWYNGSDELGISLYDSKNDIISELVMQDDGITGINKSISRISKGIFMADSLEEGVYRLEFSDFDGLIRSLSFNTGKVVVDKKIYLADSNVFFPGLEKSSTIYTNTSRYGEISFRTWHHNGLQNVVLDDQTIRVKEISNATSIRLLSGFHVITSPKNDIIIENSGYFSFTPGSYFEPFVNRILPVRNDVSWIEENLDYIVTDYAPPLYEEGWYTANTEFFIDDLYLVDNQLSFVISIPLLSGEASGNQVSIDWINITVYKPGSLY